MEIKNNWLLETPFAHRGWHNSEIPENSILAISEAIKRGYGVEIDVRATQDGQVVVFHDEKLSRLTGIDGYVTNSTYDGIKNLKLTKSNEHIPLLEEVLSFINGRVPVLVEIKNLNKVSFEKQVYDVIKNYKGDIAIMSLNPKTVEWFKLNAPHVRRGIVGGNFTDRTIPRTIRKQLHKLKVEKIAEPNFIAYNVQDIPNTYLKKYSSLPILAWTIRTSEDIDKCKKLGYNIIIENIEV